MNTTMTMKPRLSLPTASGRQEKARPNGGPIVSRLPDRTAGKVTRLEPPKLAPVPAERPELNEAQRLGQARRAAQRALLRATHTRMLDTRAELAIRFPRCFMPIGHQTKLPLMLGIDRAACEAAPDLDRHDVINAVADYCTGRSYLAAMIEGAARVDLHGNAVGVVSAGNEAFAKMRLGSLKQNLNSKI